MSAQVIFSLVYALLMWILTTGIISLLFICVDKKSVKFGHFKHPESLKALHRGGCFSWLLFIIVMCLMFPGGIILTIVLAVLRNKEKESLMEKFRNSAALDQIVERILSVKDNYIYYAAGLSDFLVTNNLENVEFFTIFKYEVEGLPNLTEMEAEALTRVLSEKLKGDFELIKIPDVDYPDGLYLLERTYKEHVNRSW